MHATNLKIKIKNIEVLPEIKKKKSQNEYIKQRPMNDLLIKQKKLKIHLKL